MVDDRIKKTVGGAVAGVCEAVCLHPTDTVKTRLQLQRKTVGLPKYRGAIHCAVTITREEGFRALYKGLTPFTTHLMTKYSLRFFTHSSLKKVFSSAGAGQSAATFLAGVGAGVIEAVMIVTPFEVVKIRLQSQEGLDKSALKYKGPVDAARQIVRNEGVFALWNGLTPTLLRNGSNQAINFTCYDLIRRSLWGKKEGDNSSLSPWKSFATGAIAGGIGPLVNAPCDVIKTRLMQQTPDDPNAYRGFVHAFRSIWRDEGYMAFYKGILPRLARIAPGQAITWTVVEFISDLLS